MTTTANNLLGSDGHPCEGCEGSSGLAPITTKGYCPACEAAAISRHGEAQGRFYVGYRSLNLTEDEHYEGMTAVEEGRACDLFACPSDGTLQGVASTRVVRGHPQGFDGGEIITLRCGHILI